MADVRILVKVWRTSRQAPEKIDCAIPRKNTEHALKLFGKMKKNLSRAAPFFTVFFMENGRAAPGKSGQKMLLLKQGGGGVAS